MYWQLNPKESAFECEYVEFSLHSIHMLILLEYDRRWRLSDNSAKITKYDYQYPHQELLGHGSIYEGCQYSHQELLRNWSIYKRCQIVHPGPSYQEFLRNWSIYEGCQYSHQELLGHGSIYEGCQIVNPAPLIEDVAEIFFCEIFFCGFLWIFGAFFYTIFRLLFAFSEGFLGTIESNSCGHLKAIEILVLIEVQLISSNLGGSTDFK